MSGLIFDYLGRYRRTSGSPYTHFVIILVRLTCYSVVVQTLTEFAEDILKGSAHWKTDWPIIVHLFPNSLR